MSFTSKYVKYSKASNVFFIQTQTKSGFDAWWYLLVDAIKKDNFAKAMQQGGCDLKQFGRILKAGYDVPSDTVQALMLEEYGFAT